MFELLFTGGIIGQCVLLLALKKPQITAYIWGGLAVLLLIGLGEAQFQTGFLDSLGEVIAAAGMTCLFLVIPILGLGSMLAAPRLSPWIMLGLQGITLFVLYPISELYLWVTALLIGIVCTLLCCIPAVWRMCWGRAVLYGWSLLVSAILALTYIFPLLEAYTLPPFQNILAGMLIFSFGLMAVFSIKYMTIFVATLCSGSPTANEQLRTWLDTKTVYYAPYYQDVISCGLVFLGLFAVTQQWVSLSFVVTLGLSLLVLPNQR